jgi:ABC-type uncharacterized transport system ATPase subunit
MSTPRLQLRGITKRYPGVVANQSVSLDVAPGQIHAVLGENGAGKSTLMKIIYGTVKPDEGEVVFNGQTVQVRNPQEARALGISMVFQHFSLFDTLTVAENVWLGLDKSLSLDDVRQSIQSKAEQYGLEIETERPVHTLSVGEMQRVEIVRALLTQPQLLILDEPTSVLTPQAVEKLFVVLRRLAAEGCSILYISHKLHGLARRSSHGRVRPSPREQRVFVALDDRRRARRHDAAPGPWRCRRPARAGFELAQRRPFRHRFARRELRGSCGRGGGHCRRVGQWPERAAVCLVG